MATPEYVVYTREFIEGFAQTEAILPDRCIDGRMEGGGSVVFDIADLGGELPERGVDGNLSRLAHNDTQVTCALKEYGGSFRITNFEMFKSQSDERKKMNRRIYSRANRRSDKLTIAELANATTQWNGGAAITVNVDTITQIISELEEAQVPVTPEDVTWLVTPKFHAKLETLQQFTSADYVSTKPLDGGAGAGFANTKKIKAWSRVGWAVSPLLPGMGTATATTFLFHRNAIGCARPSEAMKLTTGFNDEHHYHYASATLKGAAKILQNGGIIKVTHADA